MPIQNFFKLTKNHRTQQKDIGGRKFVDTVNKIAALPFIPTAVTNINVQINYKNKQLTGNLIQAVSDIQQIDPNEVLSLLMQVLILTKTQ